VLVGGIVYLAASFVLWRLLLKEPPPMAPRRHRSRWPRRLAKAFATLVGGTRHRRGFAARRRDQSSTRASPAP